jgi:hypothetical protein
MAGSLSMGPPASLCYRRKTQGSECSPARPTPREVSVTVSSSCRLGRLGQRADPRRAAGKRGYSIETNKPRRRRSTSVQSPGQSHPIPGSEISPQQTPVPGVAFPRKLCMMVPMIFLSHYGRLLCGRKQPRSSARRVTALPFDGCSGPHNPTARHPEGAACFAERRMGWRG